MKLIKIANVPSVNTGHYRPSFDVGVLTRTVGGKGFIALRNLQSKRHGRQPFQTDTPFYISHVSIIKRFYFHIHVHFDARCVVHGTCRFLFGPRGRVTPECLTGSYRCKRRRQTLQSRLPLTVQSAVNYAI